MGVRNVNTQRRGMRQAGPLFPSRPLTPPRTSPASQHNISMSQRRGRGTHREAAPPQPSIRWCVCSGEVQCEPRRHRDGGEGNPRRCRTRWPAQGREARRVGSCASPRTSPLWVFFWEAPFLPFLSLGKVKSGGNFRGARAPLPSRRKINTMHITFFAMGAPKGTRDGAR